MMGLANLDGMPQCWFDCIHQRFLRQDLKDGGLLVHSGGGQVGAGLGHGCCKTSRANMNRYENTLEE